MIVATAEHTKTHPLMGLVTSLAMVSATMNGRARIQFRRGTRAFPLHLWCVGVSPSGSGKSGVVDALIRPLETAISAVSTPNTPEARPSLWDHLEHEHMGATALDAATAMRRRQLEIAPETEVSPLVDDVTPEALVEVMSEQEMRSIIISAEAGFSSFLGPGVKSQRHLGMLNKMWDGAAVQLQRVTRERHRVERPALTLGVLIQTHPWEEMVKVRSLVESGFLPRALVCNIPSTRVRAPFPPIPHEIEHRYHQAINRLLMLQEISLCLSADALEENWNQFNQFKELEESLPHPQNLWAAKAPNSMLRLAGLIHLAGHNHDTPGLEVGVESVKAAAGIVRTLLLHVEELVPSAQVAGSRPSSDIEVVERVIIEHCGPAPFSRSVFNRYTRQFLGRSHALDAALFVLVERGRLTAKHTTTGGRPTVMYAATSS